MPDAYDRTARIAPFVLVMVPALSLLLIGGVRLSASSSWAAVAVGALSIVVGAHVRDRGRALQPGLYRRWGGAPTTARLRWQTQPPDVVRRRHAALEVVTGEPLPSPEEERRDPEGADLRYEQAVESLRALTRKADDFPLVAAENRAYGFRRNLLGLRPAGLFISGTVAPLALLLWLVGGQPRFLPCAVIGLLWLGCALRLDGAWVRAAAERYAEQLLETAEVLRRDRPAPARVGAG